mgnify:FL=1
MRIKKDIHKGVLHDNGCEHLKSQYMFSCKTFDHNDEVVGWDIYLLPAVTGTNSNNFQLCLRNGDEGHAYSSVSLEIVIRDYLNRQQKEDNKLNIAESILSEDQRNRDISLEELSELL